MGEEGLDPGANSQDAEGEKVFDAAYVREVRQEAAKYRTRAKELAARLDALEAERKGAEETKLAEQQRWRELAEQREKELGQLIGLKDELSSIRAVIKDGNEKRIAGLPDRMKTLVPEFADPIETAKWLDTAWPTLTQPVAPSLDGGAGATKRPGESQKSLTEDQLGIARKLGLTPEEYADELNRKR